MSSTSVRSKCLSQMCSSCIFSRLKLFMHESHWERFMAKVKRGIKAVMCLVAKPLTDRVRPRVTWFWYKPFCFSNVYYFVIMLSRYWSLPLHGQLQPHSKSKAWQLSTQLLNDHFNCWFGVGICWSHKAFWFCAGLVLWNSSLIRIGISYDSPYKKGDRFQTRGFVQARAAGRIYR